MEGFSRSQLVGELLVAKAMGLVGTDAKPLAAASLVDIEVTLADVHVAIPFEGDDRCGQSVKKPTIVSNN